MTIHITDEIKKAHEAFLSEAIDWTLDGKPITRRQTVEMAAGFGLTMYDIVTFAAGYQAARSPVNEQEHSAPHDDATDQWARKD